MNRSLRSASGLAALAVLAAASVLFAGASLVAAEPLPVDVPTRETPIDFEGEVLPTLRSNCVACHNDKKNEAGLSLESREAMLKGGDTGPAVVPGNADASLLFLAATHRSDSVMPPTENEVGAKSLTPRGLGLLKLWIDQGAVARSAAARTVEWSPLPSDYRPIFALAVTPDGQYGACARGNGLSIYHLPTGRLAATLVDPALESEESGDAPAAAHVDVIRSLAFDRAGDRLASGAFREAKIWRRPRLAKLDERKFDGPAVAVAVSPDGKRIAIGDERGRIHLWSRGSADVRVVETGSGATAGLAFLPDGETLCSASTAGVLRRWNAERGEAIGAAIETGAPIKALALDAAGTLLATGGEDGKIRIWKVEDLIVEGAKPIQEISAHDGVVSALAARPNFPGQFLSGGTDGGVKRIDANSGEVAGVGHHGAPVDGLAVRPDGQRVASVGGGYLLLRNEEFEEIVRLQVDPRIDAEVARFDSQIAFAETALDHAKNDIKLYEGSERRVMTTEEAVKKAEEELAKAEKARDEKKQAAEQVKDDEKRAESAKKELDDAETAVGVARTVVERAKIVAEKAKETLASDQEAVKRREAELEQLKQAKTAADDAKKSSKSAFRSVAFSPDGARLIVGCDDGTLHSLTADEASPVEFVSDGASAAKALAFGGDGVLAALSADGKVSIFDAGSAWKLERSLGGEAGSPLPMTDRVLALDFSPDGKSLAIGGGVPARQGELFVVDVESGSVRSDYSASHADTIFAARFSPDGSRLATACGDRMVRILDAQSATVQLALPGHTAHVLSVSWRGDGSQIVSCGVDRMLKLWDAKTGAQVFSMKGTTYQIGPYKGEVAAATFIGDSEQIFAASGDGTVRLHRASSESDVLTYKESSGYQYAVACSSDGSALLAGGEDGILRQWKRREPTPVRVYAP